MTAQQEILAFPCTMLAFTCRKPAQGTEAECLCPLLQQAPAYGLQAQGFGQTAYGGGGYRGGGGMGAAGIGAQLGGMPGGMGGAQLGMSAGMAAGLTGAPGQSSDDLH